MSDEDKNLAREIVIVRRRKGGGEEGHHGGAWKIAYADFMTAMMAFFLVMWLVSMTDDKSLVQIANYFNPIQLTDRSPSYKGIRDFDPKAFHGEADGSKKDSGNPARVAKPSPGQARMERARQEKAAAEEAKIFLDPAKTLEEAASAADADLVPERGSEYKLAGLDEVGLRKEEDQAGPDLFDPFDPRVDTDIPRANPTSGPDDLATTKSDDGKTTRNNKPTSQVKHSDKTQIQDEQKQQEKANDEKAQEIVGEQGDASDLPKMKTADVDVERLKSAISTAVRDLKQSMPTLMIEAQADGALITVMENEKSEMFRRGSAAPLPQTVKLLERLSAVLRSEKGTIVVRGHTDATQFRSTGYDNWRLSTARAHMAHYMLRRGGVSDERIARIEGLADKRLRNLEKPTAPENRRIEFLLSVGVP
jgi:chemotaxis protein MotB